MYDFMKMFKSMLTFIVINRGFGLCIFVFYPLKQVGNGWEEDVNIVRT